MWFELRNEEDDSVLSTESEEEVERMTLVVRRLERIRKLVEGYIPPSFHSKFVLTSIIDEPKSVGEAVDSLEGKLWMDAMLEEIELLYKNET